MAGNRSWWVIAALTGAALTQPLACDGPAALGEKSATAAAQSAVVGDVLGSVWPHVMHPALVRFQDELDALDAALVEWELALEAGADGSSERAAAQDQWLSTMVVWQELEMFQIGPAASSLTAIAGADIRDEVYSWPTINACRVDQETVNAEWGSEDFFASNLVNSYGMDALEHLLHAGADSECPGQVDPVADGSWDTLGANGVAQHRAAFSRALAQEIWRQTGVLIQAWAEGGGGFSSDLMMTTADSPYASEQEALNAVFDALFYLETGTKDAKLAQPLGVSNCGDSSCPEDVELLVSGSSLEAIRGNLLGFEALFTGGTGTGLDALLADMGHEDLALRMVSNTAAAIAAVDEVAGPLDEAVVDRSEQVEALYEAVKLVTDDLKGDLATVLVLEIPSEAAGDND